MSNLDKCKELIESFTEEQLAGVVDILSVYAAKAADTPAHELIKAPAYFSVVTAADTILREQKLSLVSALDALCCYVVVYHKLPWEEFTDLPNATTIASIEEARLMEAGVIPSKVYTNIDEMLKELSE